MWLAGAFAVGRADLLHAQQQGSAPAQAFARADVAALQAHADESLTLIDNSGDDAYQQDFLAQQKLLGPGPGTLLAAVQASAASGGPGSDVAAEAQAWYRAHAALRALDDGGNHAAAVTSAQTGDAATSVRAAVRDPQRRDRRPPGRLRLQRPRRPGRVHRPGRGHDRGVAGDGGRLRLGAQPPARGVPVNARPRRPWRTWPRALLVVLAASGAGAGAAAAAAAPGHPAALRAAATGRAPGAPPGRERGQL